jgi:hypothetical protein
MKNMINDLTKGFRVPDGHIGLYFPSPVIQKREHLLCFFRFGIRKVCGFADIIFQVIELQVGRLTKAVAIDWQNW